jgi:hypothetical protein
MGKQRRISRNDGRQTRAIPRAFVDELLYCTDGTALARKHLAMGPVALMLGVITIFGGLETALQMDCFVEAIPSPPILDYLEQALKILGMPEIAIAVKTNLIEALRDFLKVAPSIDLQQIERHADAMSLLLAV